MSLTPEDVRYAAALAHIALEPDELEALARDLAGDQVDAEQVMPVSLTVRESTAPR